MQRPALGSGERQFVSVPPLAQGTEFLEEEPGDRNSPLFVVLRSLQVQLPRLPPVSLLDVDPSPPQIDPTDLHRGDLSPPKAGVGEQQNQAPILTGTRGEPFDLDVIEVDVSTGNDLR
ncbi:hypothetical protein BJF83_24850 [Nocardiopsis sp. CNR-923]|nr:hypothetical protein BJF83_24850 [Nocardiopsis sp. CNR-923]